MNSKPARMTAKVDPKIKGKQKSKAKSKPKLSKHKTPRQDESIPVLNKPRRVIQSASTHRPYTSGGPSLLAERGEVQLKRTRPESSSNTKYQMSCRIRLKELVTEEDVLTLSDQDEEFEEYPCTVNNSADLKSISVGRAAVMIQKMWRGYQTRKIVKTHVEGYKGQQKAHTLKRDENLEKTHKLLHNRKKSNLEEVIDMTETKLLAEMGLAQLLRTGSDGHASHSDIGIKTELTKEGKSGRRVDLQLQRLKRDQAQKWGEIIKLIQYIPNEDVQGSTLLRTLIAKSEENRSELQNAQQTVIYGSSPNLQSHTDSVTETPSGPMVIINQHKFTQPLSDRVRSQGLQDHPFMKIIELQTKMMKDRLNIQLKCLDKKLKASKITNENYQQRKNQLLKQFQQEEKNVLFNKSQIGFSLQKAHDAIISSKRDASFLYRTTGKQTSLRHSISDQTVLLRAFIKQGPLLDDTLSSCNNSLESLHIKRTSTQLESLESPAVNIDDIEMNILTSELQMDEMEMIEETKEMQSLRQTAEYIQKKAEEYIINELTLEIYLNDKISAQFLPYFQLHNNYKFKRLTEADIDSFLKTLSTVPFRPNKQDLLKKLNQKINPTARQLLKILRNQELEEEDDNQFYELIIPEATFKEFRQWKESSIATDLLLPPTIKNPVNVESLSETAVVKLAERSTSAKQRKKKLLKFQKDLQAMYYKAVFNCFNEAIIQVKCSFSVLNGRSTIGPGQLRVSLLDSNVPVSSERADLIIEKGRERVMQNFKFKCPSLDTSNYSSLNRFQEALMKQINHQFNMGQHKWVSFFDQYLEIATELTGVLSEHLVMEVTKEIFKMQLCRI